MSPRNLVKHLLKMVGHALVSSVHERLDQTDRQLDVVIDQNNRLARTQTALMQASIHIIELYRNELQKSLINGTHSLDQSHQAFLDGLNTLEHRQKWLEEHNEKLLESNYRFLTEIAKFKAQGYPAPEGSQNDRGGTETSD